MQSVLTEALNQIDENSDNDSLGATIEAFPIVFLGNVDAKVESSARFRLPGGDQFLKIAQNTATPRTSSAPPWFRPSRKPCRPLPP